MTTIPSNPPPGGDPSGTRQPLDETRLRDLAHLAENAGTSLTAAAAFLQAGPAAMLDLIAEIARLRAAGEPAPEPSPDDERAAFTRDLRRFAAGLDAWHDLPLPYTDTFNVPLSTNEAVETFAGARGLKVAYDTEGNSSAEMSFGTITYHVYGYTDFAAHRKATAERDARRWADQNGMEIRPAEPPAAEAKPYTVTPAGLEAMQAACLRAQGRLDAEPVTVAALAELGYAVQDRGPYAWITDDGRQYVAEHQAREARKAGEQS